MIRQCLKWDWKEKMAFSGLPLDLCSENYIVIYIYFCSLSLCLSFLSEYTCMDMHVPVYTCVCWCICIHGWTCIWKSEVMVFSRQMAHAGSSASRAASIHLPSIRATRVHHHTWLTLIDFGHPTQVPRLAGQAVYQKEVPLQSTDSYLTLVAYSF